MKVESSGQVVEFRDFSALAPADIRSDRAVRGKWHLRPYRLADGRAGKLLMVNDPAKDEGAKAIPPEFEISLPLSGWYAVWIGVPKVDLRPRVAGLGGVDVALDTDPAFVRIGPEAGTRKGRFMGPMDVEVMCYWKCAKLDSRTLRVRVPYGTFSSFPWGVVRGSISALRLVKLSDEEVTAYQKDISDPAAKRVIVVNDGFSHYWSAAEPGKGIDARFVQSYRDSDVKMLLFQSSSTGVASWPSRVADLPGQEVPEEKWKLLRSGDRRLYDYLRWAVDHGQEGMKVISRLCREAGIEFHPSLRMNLFFQNGGMGSIIEEFLNGRFWREHPELRKPGGPQLDYARPAVRRFIIDILKEMAGYDADGINLDFTRWPPIADPARHGPEVLTGFIREVRQALPKIKLSVLVVDGYHAGMNLEEQRIDLEAWLATGAMDFICVQAWDQPKYLSLARRYGAAYYCISDQDSFNVPGGWRNDPDWQQEDRADEDPLPGEEFEAEPHLNSSLDPAEYDKGFLDRYRIGVDGVCVVNNFVGWRTMGRMGHVEEMAQRAKTGKIWGQEIGPGIEIL